MSPFLSIALVQYNFHVGFIAGNTARIIALYNLAAVADADLVVFSEMAITGYPPEDMVLSHLFLELSMEAVEELARATTDSTAMLVGGIWRKDGILYNAAFLLEGGTIIHRQYKYHLPNYGIFDEKRLFAPGLMPEPVSWRDTLLGLLICEDMWLPDVAAHLKAQGAALLISIHASPYEVGKAAQREQIAAARAHETGLPLVYVNQIGGQDDVVFDGGSFALSAAGDVCLRLQSFKEDFALLSLNKTANKWEPATGVMHPQPADFESIYYAMLLGLRDFVTKNGYSGIVLGLSGGIDSALSAAVAVDALGAERVHLFMLPSPVTSNESIEDATECANRLGAHMDIIPIEPAMQAFTAMLSPDFAGPEFDIIAANNQTRIRASILLAISSQKRALLLTTGNKSEMATGYTTIYGDMCGYYSVLKDVYKTTVYKLVEWRNQQGEVIPQRIITKPPSGETMPGQKDQDTLPPYDLLDEILTLMVEQQLSVEEVIAQGFERMVVELVRDKLFASEFKRRQSAPGVKITGMLFGHDRHYPITSVWRAEKLLLTEN